MPRFVLLLFVTLVACTRPALADSPDRQKQDGVPAGKVTTGVFTESKIYPGTKRDYAVYVPAQYTADKPASLMV
ncbi:MAG TPA: hypothetical protein VM510_13980, partial [Caulifigura sp.]|nr:hypothetical protein [Caulifigura sp.]